MIFETIIISQDAAGKPHLAPFGIQYEGDFVVISPYKPSLTLDNILSTKHAVMNLTDDVRIFASVLTNQKMPDLVQASKIQGLRLADCLAHVELKLVEVHEHATRPQLVTKKIAEFNHKAFAGFNRAQAAVIELAVLVSRLHMLTRDKIETELAYLQIAIDKTAGRREQEAWQRLTEKIERFYVENKA